MGYVSSSLLPGERLIARTSFHPLIYLRPLCTLFAACVLIALASRLKPTLANMNMPAHIWIGLYTVYISPYLLALAAGCWLLATFAKVLTTELAVTSERVIARRGVLSSTLIEMKNTKVETIHVVQSLVAKICGFGTVILVGTGGSREAFYFIADPLAFRRAVQSQLP